MADAVGDIREIALVGADGGQVFRLADQVERPEGFPNLVCVGIYNGDLSACGYVRACRDHSADAAGDRGADFCGLLGICDREFCDQPALMDGGAGAVGVDDFAGLRGSDLGRLQKCDDLRTAGCVSEAD